MEAEAKSKISVWINDWCLFAEEALGAILDEEQSAILRSVQVNRMTSVVSGTARGKDFISAVAAVCFMYLTPKWDKNGELIENTKVAMTAPTDRQVGNIMAPEIARLFGKAKSRGIELPGRLTGYDIRTDNKEWFLTGFKADEHRHEAWSGFHAVNTMFVITEASGISENIYSAIEGNLQGNSRILIVFNPNTSTGYAANSQRSPRWNKFRLNSLNAPNVKLKRILIPGQVDYDWVKDKIETWATPIRKDEFLDSEDDFEFEDVYYRPNDLFRIKVLGKFPKVSSDTLIPLTWIQLAQERWQEYNKRPVDHSTKDLRLGVDVAGMGRDNSDFCYRFDNYVQKFYSLNSGGQAEHMKVVGIIVNDLNIFPKSIALIDTIGEGAGVYSRLNELGYCENTSKSKYGFERAISAKASNAARDDYGKDLTDVTGQYKFANMRAYLFWAARDWLDPKSQNNACLPPDDDFTMQATEIKYSFQSNGSILIEPKDDIKARIGKSPDKWDSFANTFWPVKQKSLAKPLTKQQLGFY
jgi:hypothetical protein